jgi:DNA-binding NtrC family response regulator
VEVDVSDGFHIMVVADEGLGRQTAQGLRQQGHHAESVDDVSHALQHLSATPADAVVVDLDMAGLDGLELLRRFHERYPQVPAILTTARATVEGAVAAMQAGAADYLVKPYRIEDLVLRLQRIRELRAARGRETTGVFSLQLEGVERVQFNQLLEQLQDELIRWALGRAGGQQKRAAELLGIPRTTLQSRMLRLREGCHGSQPQLECGPSHADAGEPELRQADGPELPFSDRTVCSRARAEAPASR